MNLPRQRLDLHQWKEKFFQLWTLFGQNCGLAPWSTEGLDVTAPQLPIDEASPSPILQSTIESQCVQFHCSFGTANVQSLYRGPDGHAGKLSYLQEQMRFFGLNIMAVQEARSEEAMTQNNNILRISSGCDRSCYGVEIWIDLDLPYIGPGRAKLPRKFTKEHFQVVHRDPRRLLLRCDTGIWMFWILCGHAPHSGISAEQREEWWSTTSTILEEYVDTRHLVVMIDANAAPGEQDDTTVFSSGFATSTSTKAFRSFLTDWQLYLPITSEVHHGPTGTWTSFTGSSAHCIDHIALPREWYPRCTHSQILDQFDLATTADDHQVVALQLQWYEQVDMASDPHELRPAHPSSRCSPTSEMRQQLRSLPVSPWHTDIETQAKGLAYLTACVPCFSRNRQHLDVRRKSPTLMIASGPFAMRRSTFATLSKERGKFFVYRLSIVSFWSGSMKWTRSCTIVWSVVSTMRPHYCAAKSNT